MQACVQRSMSNESRDYRVLNMAAPIVKVRDIALIND